MTIVTKAFLAAELGVTKARVSQYVKQGMPVRKDGKVDRDDAVKWISAFSPADGRPQHRGVNRATEIVKQSAATKAAKIRSDSATLPGDAEQLALADLIGKLKSIVAYAVVHSGGDPKLAFFAASIVQMEAIVVFEEISERLTGVDASDLPSYAELIPPHEPDWVTIAVAAGHEFDNAGWDAEQYALPYWRDDRPDILFSWEEAANG